MPSLKMLRGPEPGRSIPLEGEVLHIGRGRKNDIIIQDNEVSRTHCRLVRVLDDYEIHDLSSTNGTFVNGKEVPQGGILLYAHSILELGDSITLEYLPTDVTTGTNPPILSAIEGEAETVYYLVIKQASMPQPEIYLLDRSSLSMGRDVDNEIVLQEPEVSRHHMRLLYTENGYAVEDLNTMNGTWVNDRRLTEQRILNLNDMVRVGTRVQMWYTTDPDELIHNLKTGTVEKKSGDSSDDDAFTVTDTTLTTDLTTDEKTMTDVASAHGLAPNALAKSIFLAYAPAEWKLIIAKLFEYLESNGIKIWAAQHLQPETPEWHDAIEQAQQESPVLLAILSKRSLDVPYVQRSIRHFVTRDKPILLVQLGKLEQEPMATEPLPKIRFDTRDPMRTFRLILAELRKVNLDGQ
jgi:pSer/pThr/pTyr-binding forkhead associated (FHA) protein